MLLICLLVSCFTLPRNTDTQTHSHRHRDANADADVDADADADADAVHTSASDSTAATPLQTSTSSLSAFSSELPSADFNTHPQHTDTNQSILGRGTYLPSR